MQIWEQELYIKAWNFASRAHSSQYLACCKIPYINHLGLVTMEACSLLMQNEVACDPNLLVQVAILHDVLEDTVVSYAKLEQEFGAAVATGVLALSKNESLPKSQQILDSLARIKEQSVEIWIVKMCDRITNLQEPPASWGEKKIAIYYHESHFILEALGSASPYLAKRLAMKIDNYKQYVKINL